MVDYLVPEKSRIFIFGKPVQCYFCAHDIFIPYETFVNVEKPGIGMIFVNNTAICQQCGFVLQFGDPSYYDNQKDDFIWALDQQLIDERPAPEVPVPLIEAGTLDKYRRCIDVALQLLVRQHEAPKESLAMHELGDYAGLAQAFDAEFHQTDSQLVVRDCLGLLLKQLKDKGIMNCDVLIKGLQENDEGFLGAFLKAALAER